MSQVFLDLALLKESVATNQRLPKLIEVTDTLRCPESKKYDLVIGNPPYSKIKLDKEMRMQYERSLYGHANLYGLFTDKALSMLSPNGVLAYVTPTSFLSGQYFKKLRYLLSVEAHPINAALIHYIQNQVSQDEKRNLAKCYVLIDEDDNECHIWLDTLV